MPPGEVTTMNMEVNDFKVRQQEYWALQQAREDRAAVAAMDVVEELSMAHSPMTGNSTT